MTRLVHLTDLHFGAARSALVAPLHHALRAVAPDLVIVTGDLSHRGRRHQLRKAMKFLEALDMPFIATPGNHDVPLYNLVARFLFPFWGWRSVVGSETSPPATAGPFRIFTANTADPQSIRRGLLREGDLAKLHAGLAQGPPDMINVLACHHPLTEPPGFDRGETRGAAAALPQMAQSGLHVVLTGHLHHWSIGLGVTATETRPLLMIQSGTALCARRGEKDHGFAVLEAAEQGLRITPWAVDEAALEYRPLPGKSFQREARGWRLRT